MAERIKFEVYLDNGQLKVATKDTKKEFDKLKDKTEGINKKLSKLGSIAKIAMVSVVAIFAKMGSSVTKLASKFEKTSVAFETMLGGGKKGKAAAEKLLKDIQKFASKTPLSFDDLTQGSKRLLAFGTNVNDLIPTMKMLGDASQGNAEVLDRLTLAYGKIQARGKTSMEELNQITEAGVPILKELADGYNVSQEELFKMVSAGQVGFGDVQKALQSLTGEGGQFNGMMEKMSSTLGGKWSTFKDQMELSALAVGEKLLPRMHELLDVLMDSDSLIPALIRGIGQALGIFASAITQVIRGIDLLFSKGEFEDVSRSIKMQESLIKRLEKKQKTLKKGSREYREYTELIKSAEEEIKRLQIGNLRFQQKANKQKIKDMQGTLRDLTDIQKRFRRGESVYGYGKKQTDLNIISLEKKLIALQKENKEYDRQISKLQAIGNLTTGNIGKYKTLTAPTTAPKKGSKGDKSGDKGFSFNDYLSYQDSVLGASMDLYNTISEYSNQYYENEIAKVDNLLNKRLEANQLWYESERDTLLNSQMDHEARTLALSQLEAEKEKRDKKIEEDATKRKRKLVREQFKREQASSIASVWINSAVAIMKAFAQMGPILGAIMTPLILATAGVQTGIISSQKPPAMATGTTNVPEDMLANIHKGEGVIPKTFMDGVKAGELTIGSGGGSGTTNIFNIEGSVTTEKELFNRIDEMRNERSQELGQNNYGR